MSGGGDREIAVSLCLHELGHLSIKVAFNTVD